MIRVRVLGASEISIGHRRIGMNTEVLFALALYLTTRAGERLAREDLLEIFWTKGSGEQRRHALRQLLYRLRQKGFTLDEDGEWIYIDPPRVESDLRDALGDQWVEHAGASAIDAAATLTTQFSRRIAPGFLEWFDGVRDRLALQHRRASLAQIVLARREGRWNDLERWAQSVLRSDPLNEEATLARAESAAMAGSKTIALEILDNYLQEVGEVAPELGRPAALLRKRIAERRPDWATRGPKEVALIGRTELMSRLTGLVDAAWRGEGSAVILTGAPGIGKTRLAMEARAYAELKGMRTVVVRAEAANVERPLAVVQELIELFLELPGVAGCDPESLRLVRTVVDRRQLTSHRDAAARMASVREYLSGALRDLLEAVMHECRVMVVFDDYHHIDDASLDLLRSLMMATSRRRIFWIGSARSGLHAEKVRTSLEGNIPLVRVGGLTADSARLLASATSAAHLFDLPEHIVAHVATASAGNPLFVRELSVAKGSRPDERSLPESLTQLIAERLERLPSFQLRTLRVIALLGKDSTPARLNRIIGVDRVTLSQTIEALEDDGLLHVTSALTFALHECWQQALLDSLQGATRVSLAHECALALVDEPEIGASAHTLWRAAELFGVAGETGRAVALYEVAAEHLFAACLPHEAAIVLQRTATLVTSSFDRTRVFSRLATVYMAAGDPESVLEVSSKALDNNSLSGGRMGSEIAACMCARAEALLRLGRITNADLQVLKSLAIETSLSPATRQLVCQTGIRIVANQAEKSEADHFYSWSREIASQHGPSTLSGLTGIVYRAEFGPLSGLIEEQELLSASESNEQSMYWRCMALRFRCQSLRIQGQIELATAEGERAYSLARGHSLFHDAHIACELLVFLHLDHNNCDRAAEWVERLAELNVRTPYHERTIALGHASDRLRMQRGQYAIVADRLLERQESIRMDRRPVNRSAEFATLAFCLAMSGRQREAVQVLPAVAEATSPIRGRFGADYPTELMARTYREIGQESEAKMAAEVHITEQRHRLLRPLPPFYRELREASERLAIGTT